MSHKFHGKASGKMKTEKRMKKQQDEMVSYEKVGFHPKIVWPFPSVRPPSIKLNFFALCNVRTTSQIVHLENLPFVQLVCVFCSQSL